MTSTKGSKYDKYFSRIDNSVEVYCILCKANGVLQKYSRPVGGGTGSMMKHLLNKHQITIEENHEWNKLDEAIADFMLETSQPASMLNKESFKNIILQARANPENNVLNATNFYALVHTKFKQEKETLIKRLGREKYITLTLDHWTSTDSKSYLGVIIDWIDKSFVFHSRMVDFEMVAEHSANVTFYEHIRPLLEEYQILMKMSGFCGDSTAAMAKTLDIAACQTTLPDKRVLGHLCFAHLFQLAIRKGLTGENDNELLANAVGNLKKIVNYVKGSTKFTFFMKEIFAKEGIPFLMPKNSNITRWDSTFMMIESTVNSLVTINKALEQYENKYPGTKLPEKLEPYDILILQKLRKTLSMFRNVTLQAQEQGRSISGVILLNYFVLNCCAKCKDSTYVFIKKLGCAIEAEFKIQMNKYKNMDGLWRIEYVVAAFLDVETKRRIISLDTDKELEKQFKLHLSTIVHEVTETNTLIEPVQRKMPKLSFEAMMDSITDDSQLDIYTREPDDNENPRLSEIDHFLANNAKWNGSNLQWWSAHKTMYPLLAEFAKSLFCIPISSASIERSFSGAKQVIKENRSRLSEWMRKETLILKVNATYKGPFSALPKASENNNELSIS